MLNFLIANLKIKHNYRRHNGKNNKFIGIENILLSCIFISDTDKPTFSKSFFVLIIEIYLKTLDLKIMN